MEECEIRKWFQSTLITPAGATRPGGCRVAITPRKFYGPSGELGPVELSLFKRNHRREECRDSSGKPGTHANRGTSVTTPPEVLEAALAWYAHGFCVIPPKQDGTKAPLVDWKDYQTQIPTTVQMSNWYDNGSQAGVGLLCGKVSGNLEMLELEGVVANDSGFMQDLEYNLRDAGLLDLWEQLLDGYSEWTPSGGLHLLYRISDHEVPGNTKIARRPKDPARYTDRDRETLAKSPRAVIMETLIETRGEGGYVIVAPSQGTVHPTGNPWTRGHLAEYGVVPTITWVQREQLVNVLAGFDIPRPKPEPAPAPPRPAVPMLGTTKRVGDDFNERGTWDFLEAHGWTRHPGGSPKPGEVYWVRPGKHWTEGHSASTGYADGADRLYVWSSATVFPTEEPISRFAAYTELEHHGDYRAATKALAAQGYGEQRRPAVITQQFGSLEISQREQASEASEAALEPEGPAAPPAPPKPRAYLPDPGRQSFTDVGTANRFLAENPYKFLWDAREKEWLWYDGVIWQRDVTGNRVALLVELLLDRMADEAEHLRQSEDTIDMGKSLAKYVNSARMNSGRKGLLATIASKISIDPKDLDPHRHLLGLRNAVLDVRTGTVIPADPRYLLTRQMDVAWDPSAQAPKTREYMATVLPDERLRDFVQRSLGYTMTGEQDQRAFYVVHGIRGTGKSQFVELWGKMFGSYGTVAADAAFRKSEGRGGHTAELHALKNYRFVWSSESDEDVVYDADVVKRVCGGESMSTRTLYGKPEKWRPECVVWMATNNFPRFPADEEAVWDRVKPVGFTTVFERNTAQRVTSIADRLFDEEAPGILNLMIEWLKAYREHGLTEPQNLLAAIEDQKTEGDPVAQFWAEMVDSGEMTQEAESKTDSKLLYTHYVNWSMETLGQKPRGSRRFFSTLRVILKYDKLEKSNGRRYLLGWSKKGLNGILGTL